MSWDMFGGIIIGGMICFSIPYVSRNHTIRLVKYHFNQYKTDTQTCANWKKEHKRYMDELNKIVGESK